VSGLLGAVFLASAVAVVAGLLALMRGEVSARSLGGAAVGAVLLVALLRLVPGRRLLGGFSGLLLALMYVPILVVVIYAFNKGRNVAVWDGFSTQWFGRALDDPEKIASIWRSARIALANTAIATVLGTAAALALTRGRLATRLPFMLLVFLTLVVPELVLALAALLFFVNFGFELGPVTMFLGHAVFNTSLVLLIVRARFVSMGSRLEEAAFDLGAGPVATFWQVTLPRLAPAIVAGALLAFTFSFDDVVVSQFTSGGGNDTWPLIILSSLRFGLRPDLNAMATMMLGVTLLVLALGFLLLRRFTRAQGEAASVVRTLGR
jgi:spermidine/putrescine transport system permease protein/putrescine transport system permease protein